MTNHYCPFLGDFDIFLPYTEAGEDENSLFYNIKKIDKMFPNNRLLPIGCISSGDYIFLDEKGQVIQFVGIGKENVPSDFFTEVPKDEYDIGFNIAYLPYPDFDGLYRMYMVLAMSFDEFMNECIFGDKYLEITEKEDAFYKYIRKLKSKLNM
ncbi:MAG: hypothetical protein LBO02_02530 [Holosporaceae bacterium]|nr:hypothetical protein [Holosporaceae bacterium]